MEGPDLSLHLWPLMQSPFSHLTLPWCLHVGSELRLPCSTTNWLMTLGLALWPWEPVLQVLCSKMQTKLALIPRSCSANKIWQEMQSASILPSTESGWQQSLSTVIKLLRRIYSLPRTHTGSTDSTMISFCGASVWMCTRLDTRFSGISWPGNLLGSQTCLHATLIVCIQPKGQNYHLDIPCLSFSPSEPQLIGSELWKHNCLLLDPFHRMTA